MSSEIHPLAEYFDQIVKNVTMEVRWQQFFKKAWVVVCMLYGLTFGILVSFNNTGCYFLVEHPFSTIFTLVGNACLYVMIGEFVTEYIIPKYKIYQLPAVCMLIVAICWNLTNVYSETYRCFS